jgi:O-succinylbenzoate synthase
MMIVGRDLLQELGIVLHFGDITIAWDHAITPMKNHHSIEHNDIVAIDFESPAIVDSIDRMKQILEAKYEAANIKNVVAGCKNLSTTEQKQLFAVLTRFKSLFNGTHLER